MTLVAILSRLVSQNASFRVNKYICRKQLIAMMMVNGLSEIESYVGVCGFRIA